MSVADERDDQQVEIMIGNLLRYGVLLAATVTGIGGCVYLIRHGNEVEEYREFGDEESADFRSPAKIISGAVRGSGRALVQLGLLLLIATPVARVAFSAVAFARQRDFLYVGLTLFVLAVLLFSLFHGDR
jgi:uncharacterized membrane protein